MLLHLSLAKVSHLWSGCCVGLFSDGFSAAGIANASSQGFFPRMKRKKRERGFLLNIIPL